MPDNYVFTSLDVVSLFTNIPLQLLYINDLMQAVPDDKQEYALDVFSSLNNHIQFTIKKENNKFLGTLSVRDNNNINAIGWYTKLCASQTFF